MPKKPEVTLRQPSDNVVAFVEGRPPKHETSDVRRQTPDVTIHAEAPRTRWRRTVTTRVDGTREKRLTIRMPEDLAARFAKQCDDQGRSMSEVVTELVHQDLGDV